MAEFPRQFFLCAVALDNRLVDRALGAAEQAPGRTLDAIRVAAQKKILDRFYFHFDANAAAKFPRAATVGAERMTLVKQRIIKFLQFDRCVFYVALTHRHRRGSAVLERTTAPTAADNILADVAPAGFRVIAEDRIAAHVAFVRGRHSFRQRRRERPENRVEYGRQRQAPPTDGCRTERAE